MKRLVLLLAAVISLGVGTAAAGTTARVALVDSSPVTVSGAGFDPSSPVVVTVSAGAERLSKTVRSNAGGRFSARWSSSLETGACTPKVVSAASAHHRAAYKSMPSAAGCGAERFNP